MKKALVLCLALFSATVLFCSINFAQENDQAQRPHAEDAEPGEIGQYEYVEAVEVEENKKDYLGKYVKFVDDFAILWDDPTPVDSKEEVEDAQNKGYRGDFDNQTMASQHGYLKFETKSFRCIIPVEYEESVNYLRNLNRRRTSEEIKSMKVEPKLISVYGKLVRSKMWGEVAESGARMGTELEDFVFVVHKVERPAERFFKDVPREEE